MIAGWAVRASTLTAHDTDRSDWISEENNDNATDRPKVPPPSDHRWCGPWEPFAAHNHDGVLWRRPYEEAPEEP